jgi:hypothetical protein
VSISGDIADALVTTLNDGAGLSVNDWSDTQTGYLPLGVTATRTWLPVFELDDMTETRVTVVPRQHTSVVASRSHLEHEISCDIGIQKKLKRNKTNEDIEIDFLVNFADSIRDKVAFVDHVISGHHASFLSINSETLLAPDHLEEMRQFTHVLTVTYRVIATP